ncbi:MAG: sugar ABC transporter permease [Anaerolineae bacterium]|nr:sugar ABC transporter permease [Anaerolineae bacterium]
MTATVSQATLAVMRRRRTQKAIMKEIMGMVWTSPWWAGFLLFELYPMFAGLYVSFTKSGWGGAAPWIGLENYVTALTVDNLFWASLFRTFYYAFTVVPLGLAASLLAASILNQKIRGEGFFRTAFYIPSLMPAVALAVIWTWILNPKYGLLNQFLAIFGFPTPGWLHAQAWAMPALILMAVWGSFGGASMLIFLAALQSIPKDLFEACDLDGGSPGQKFRHITIPMISPAILFNLLMGIIGSFESFLYSFLAPETPGGPNFATYTLGLHIYTLGFQEGRMGYAAAVAWLLFLVILAVVLINYKISGRWVFMASLEEKGV